MWQTVDLRELRLFVTLADELHFGRTAERLQVTPSRVSQSVRELEHKLGAQLVHRTSRRVELTPFGEQFLVEVRPAFDQLTGVLRRTNEAARSLEGTLRLGVLSGPASGPQLLSVVGTFAELHPECQVEIVQLTWDDPLAQLRAGDVDAMASWLPLEQPDLVVGPTLSRQARVLAVARDHPLAPRESVSVEELAEYRIPRFDGWPREMHEALFPSKTPSGRPIRTSRMAITERSPLEISIRIARGEVVHPTVASVAPYLGQFDLVYVPLPDMPTLRSALAWRRGSKDPKLREFVRVSREVLKRPERDRA